MLTETQARDVNIHDAGKADEEERQNGAGRVAAQWALGHGWGSSNVPTVILTSLYSQIYRPKINRIRVRESTTMSVSQQAPPTRKKRKL